MAIKVANTTVIDDSKNAIINSITFPNATVQTTAGGLQGSYQKIYNGGSLLQTLNNANAYGTSASDSFGDSVAISGNYAIVGAPYEDDLDGNNSGKAYIYNVTTGALVHTLNNPNAYSTSADDYFGYSVAISGNYAIVGAMGEDDAGGSASGKAYIYNVATGQLVHTLNNPNAYSTSIADTFSTSVAISGNYAIVGAYQEDDAGGTQSGKAYIFNVTTGKLVHTFNNPNAYSTSADDYFGYSVGISGNYAIVGALFEADAGGTFSGKAYIFNVTTGQLVWTLNNPNAYGAPGGDVFGSSVAISGNYAIVGTGYSFFGFSEDDAGGASSGKAYIFNVTTGQLVWTLNNPNAYGTSAIDLFGLSVAISGNYAIVGTPYEDDVGGSASGKAYIYNVTTGQLVHTLNNPNAYGTSQEDFFGQYVAISGNYVIVGTGDEDDVGGASSGKAYIFALEDVYTVNGVQSDKVSLLAQSTKYVPINQPTVIIDNPNAVGSAVNDMFGGTVFAAGGNAIAINNSYLVVSSVVENTVYIFDTSSYKLIRTLSNPNVYGPDASDNFGYSIAIDSNYLVIGAPYEDDAGGANSGRVYIYELSTGTLLRSIVNPNAYSTPVNDYFGTSVAISGNYAIVGAYQEDDAGGVDSGKAYIFNVTTGALVWTLNNPNAYGTSANDNFGRSVAISGNYAIVGAFYESDAGGSSSGKAYIYNVTTGQLVHTLNNPNAYGTSADDNFGLPVAISGNYAIVSALSEDNSGLSFTGALYIYNVTTGALIASLTAPLSNNYLVNRIGQSVAASDAYIVTGSLFASTLPYSNSGKVYIYDKISYNLMYIIENPNPFGTPDSDMFGTSVAIYGTTVVVGGGLTFFGTDAEDTATAANSGKVYVYDIRKLIPVGKTQSTNLLDKLTQLMI